MTEKIPSFIDYLLSITIDTKKSKKGVIVLEIPPLESKLPHPSLCMHAGYPNIRKAMRENKLSGSLIECAYMALEERLKEIVS